MPRTIPPTRVTPEEIRQTFDEYRRNAEAILRNMELNNAPTLEIHSGEIPEAPRATGYTAGMGVPPPDYEPTVGERVSVNPIPEPAIRWRVSRNDLNRDLDSVCEEEPTREDRVYIRKRRKSIYNVLEDMCLSEDEGIALLTGIFKTKTNADILKVKTLLQKIGAI